MSQHAMQRETGALGVILRAIEYFFENLDRRLGGVDTPGQRRMLEKAAIRYEDSRNETYFGVFRRHGSDEFIRVSRHGAVHDENLHVLTVNYFADEAREYAFDPGPTSPIQYKARVTIRNGELLEITEQGDLGGVEPVRVRKERRTGELTDIMETVRRDQDELVRVDAKENILITGGPGTGKTAVGLQRLGYVMYDDRGRIGQRRVLVLGPSQAYRRYVSNFLPGLGFRDVLVRSYKEFLMEPLVQAGGDRFVNIYDDSRAAVRDKNSRGLERVLFTSIWPDNRVGAVSVRVVTDTRKPPEIRTLSKEEVQQIHDSIRESFWAQEVSYEGAREEFLRQLAFRLRQEKADPADWSRTPEGRRDALIRSLPDMIGRHSRTARRFFEQNITTSQGLNFERDILALLQTYYIADITAALELVIEENAPKIDARNSSVNKQPEPFSELLSLRAIENKLQQLDATPKRPVNPGRRLFAREARQDLGQYGVNQLTPDRSTPFGREVWKFVLSILPNRNAVRIARDSALGTNRVFNEIGVRQIEQLGRRLREYAQTTVRDAAGSEDWSTADLALLFWCNNLVNGGPNRFAHVLLDEAQDLTSLELRAIRSAIGDAPVTVAGDLQQSTTFGAVSDWDTLMASLGRGTFRRGDLTVNYRVPREVLTYACGYLTDATERAEVTSEFDGGRVTATITDQRKDTLSVVADVLSDLGSDGLIAVIASQREIDELALEESNDLLVVTPFDSKGLEVDHLVLVEPTSWYDQSSEMRRLMFVALTRATKTVTILQSRRAGGRIITPD